MTDKVLSLAQPRCRGERSLQHEEGGRCSDDGYSRQFVFVTYGSRNSTRFLVQIATFQVLSKWTRSRRLYYKSFAVRPERPYQSARNSLFSPTPSHGFRPAAGH
eukprot:3477179-Rhodomonas_salina.3